MIEERLKEKAKQLPLLPGVYLMKDNLGNIIYVGKSKALKRRVSSYFSGSKKPSKVMRMVRCICDFEVRYTDTELEALLLECRLIKEIKPLYNKLLKQDHRYRYLYLNPEEKRPRLKLVREKGEKKGLYFGPYERGSTLYEGMQLLNQIYQLPDCKASEIKENCLTYRRRQCLGPCKAPYDEEGFKGQLEKVIYFLEDKAHDLVAQYENKMQEAALALEFEKAQKLKEEWQLLKGLQFKKEAVELAKANQLVIFTLEVPKGGKKLFVMQSYVIVHSVILSNETANDLPENRLKDSLKNQMKGIQEKERLIQEILKKYDALQVSKDTCLDKERMDEIYILHGCLKHIEEAKQVVRNLEPEEKLTQSELEEILRKYIQ